MYYPIYTETDNVPYVQLPTSTYDYSKCDGNTGCIYANYIVAGIDANYASNFTLISPSYNVTTADQFWLQYSEGCCHIAWQDNSGYTCATVYFIYGLKL